MLAPRIRCGRGSNLHKEVSSMKTLRRLTLILLLLGMMALGQPVTVVQASIYQGTVQFSCTQAIASGTGAHILDRDNTGLGQERVRVDITDGAGTLLFTLTYQNALGTYGGGIGTFTYATPPAVNPITFRVTSLGGNGFAEQMDYTATGECPGLPYGPPVGPQIPAGFVQRRLSCTTAVYERPAGQLVEPRATVFAGQAWHVNPAPTLPDANGRRWTEVFVGGYITGFIPAECVGGQETLAPRAGAAQASGMTGGATGTTGQPVAIGMLGNGASGQTFVNAAGQTVYVVAQGDRLYRIALRFGVSMNALAAANGITNLNRLLVGQQLIIPR